MAGAEQRLPTRALAFQIAIVAAALVLIMVTWVFTLISIDTEEREARMRAEGNVDNLALTVEWQLRRQLQAIDQTLIIMANDWKGDPIRFDPDASRARSALLGDGSVQIFLLDTMGFVMSSTQPDMIRLDMSDRDFFAVQRASRTKGLFAGPSLRLKSAGRWEINLSRRLERADGSFAGVIVVSYDPWALASLLEQVDIGTRGLIALVGGDGAIRVLVSPGEVRPGEDVSASAMFRAVQERPRGGWAGPSAPDGVDRVHAFRRLHDQDLTIVIAMARDEAMRTATVWADNARHFALGISLMVLLMAGLLVAEIRAARRRETALANDRRVLEQAYIAVEAAKASAEAKTSQIEATLSGMSDGVMMLDAGLRLVQWNHRFPDCTGVPAALLRVGIPMAEVIRGQAMAGEFGPVDVDAEVRRRIGQLTAARQSKEPITVMYERTRPNGTSLELRRSVLPDGGIVTLYTDITARKLTEEAQRAARRLADEATEQKARFVAIVSHEIRTPLNAVVNSLALLLDQSGLSASQRRLADTARQAGDALMELVHDILELSKMEAGRLAVRPTLFELQPVLEGVREMFRAQAADRGIRLLVEMAGDAPVWLRADVGRLRQVLMNFVSNAAKFAFPGSVVISAKTGLVGGSTVLVLSVTDNGPLIAEHEARQLFQPFSRLNNARESGVPGTGLGLAICERLARLMGGQIGFAAAPDGGNRFWLSLPLETLGVCSPEPARDIALPARRRRAHILLVEDMPANHLVTAIILRREGHFVDIAESGAEALRLAEHRPYDLIFMDLLMPGMNGYEVTRRLRASSGPAARIPIVALTANTAPEDRKRCLAAGMNDMLGKPVRPAELFAMVRGASVMSKPKEWSGPFATTTSGVEILDLPRLAELQNGLSASTLSSLMDQCLSDIRWRIVALQEALLGQSTQEIEEIAHAVAGMAGNYGLAAMEAVMRKILAAARDHDIERARAHAAVMQDDLIAAAEAVQLYLTPQPD
jgi:signal transduction histidine kinase/CheY-like chemotaxis protein